MGNGKEIAVLTQENGIFGEGALYPDKNGIALRGATVSAGSENVQLLCLTKEKFDRLVASNTLNEDCMNKLKAVADKRTKENLALQLVQGEIKIEVSSKTKKIPAVELAGPTKKGEPPVLVTKSNATKLAGPPATKKDEPPVQVTKSNATKLAGPPAESLGTKIYGLKMKIKKPLIKLAGTPATKKDEPPVKVTESNAIKLAGSAESLPGLDTTSTTAPPSQSQTEEQPSDWSEMFDQTSGYPYWCNNKTGISSWEKPVVLETVEKVKILLIKKITSSERLHKIYLRANQNKKDKGSIDMLNRKRFEMIIDKVIGKKNNFQKIKNAVWNSVKIKSIVDMDLIERKVLTEWLFGSGELVK